MEQILNLLRYFPGFKSRKYMKMSLAVIFYLIVLFGMFQGLGDFIFGASIITSMLLIGTARTKLADRGRITRYFLYGLILTVITCTGSYMAGNVDPTFSKNSDKQVNTTQQAIDASPSDKQTLQKTIIAPQSKLPQIAKTTEQVKQNKPNVPQTTSSSTVALTSQLEPKSNTDPKNLTVYITKTGSKYHLDGCRYLRKSKISIYLSNAQANGYDPCSICDPPGDKIPSAQETSISTPAHSAPAYETPAQSENKSYTVYVTRTGSKYHLDGCRYLSTSQIPMSLSDAKSSGYDPCSVCGPPD